MSRSLLAGRTVGCISGDNQLESSISEITQSKSLAFTLLLYKLTCGRNRSINSFGVKQCSQYLNLTSLQDKLHIFCTFTLESLYYKSKHYEPRSDCSLGFGSVLVVIKTSKVHKQMREHRTFFVNGGKSD